MVQEHDPPSPKSGRDKRYYEHVMQDAMSSMIRWDKLHNRMNTPTFTIISCTQTSALPIITILAHEYQAQTVAVISKVVLPVKVEHKRIN
jgi:orotate phosphoribosyltransferase